MCRSICNQSLSILIADLNENSKFHLLFQGRESIPAGAMGGTRISTSLRGSPTARLNAEGPRWLRRRPEASDTRSDRRHDTCLLFQAWKWVLVPLTFAYARPSVFVKFNVKQLPTVYRAFLLPKSYTPIPYVRVPFFLLLLLLLFFFFFFSIYICRKISRNISKSVDSKLENVITRQIRSLIFHFNIPRSTDWKMFETLLDDKTFHAI